MSMRGEYMITAQEARNISNEAYRKQIDAELVSIMPKIEAAMRKGEYSCWINETNISSATRTYLEELGYEIISSTQYNETEYKIEW